MSSLILSRLTLNPLWDDTRRDLADCHNMHRRLLSAFPDEPDLAQPRNHYGLLYRLEIEPGIEHTMEAGVESGIGAGIERQRARSSAGDEASGAGEAPAVTGAGRERGERVVILVQSQRLPDWSRLPAGYLASPPEVKPLDPLYAHLRVGMEVAFRLHANPTRRINGRNPHEPAQWRGKRVNLRTEAEQLAWLRRKGEAAGFALLTVRAHSAHSTHSAHSAHGVMPGDRDAVGPASRAGATPAQTLNAAAPGGGRGRAASGSPAASALPGILDARALSNGLVSGHRQGSGTLTFGSVLFEGRLGITDLARFQAALADGIGSGKAYGFGLLSIAPVLSSALNAADDADDADDVEDGEDGEDREEVDDGA